MKHNFIIRLYQDNNRSPILTDISHLTISDITILSKGGKFEPVCFHKSNQKKFGYTIKTSKNFIRSCGSHSSSMLAFNGKYIDIIVNNFPRYPCFGQQKYSTPGYSGNPFPIWLKYREIEFINI